VNFIITESKKILIISISFRPNVGGVETHLDDLCEYLRKKGHIVKVITYQPITTKAKGFKLEKKENLEIHRIPWFGHNLFHKLVPYPLLEFLYLFPGLFFYSFFFMLKNRKEIDVIHAHGFISSFITKILASFFGKRSVMSTHAIYYLDERPLFVKMVNWTLKSFDVILPLAERSKRDLISAGLLEQKMKIYTHWVDQNIFKPLNKKECRNELKLNKDDFIVLFLGRLIREKGVREFIRSASLVNPKIKFVIVGNGPLEDIARKASLEQKNVIFSGKIPHEETPKYYNSADIFLIPTQNEEGFARVTLEALSCGTPIIATNKGCLPEIINSSVGILINPSAKNIAKKIDYFFKNPNKLKRLKDNCRIYAERHFGERNAKLIENSYGKI